MSSLDEMKTRRRWFEAYLSPEADGQPRKSICGMLYTCPCCGYPTREERGGYGICYLCGWEDDRQDDADADRVKGGPNYDLSLTKARENFAVYLRKYEPERDKRIGGPDNQVELESKRSIIRAFDEMWKSGNPCQDDLCKAVKDGYCALYRELRRKIDEYSKRHGGRTGEATVED